MGKHLRLGLVLACYGMLLNTMAAEAKAFKSFQGKECRNDRRLTDWF
jgi:hypothetical protein